MKVLIAIDDSTYSENVIESIVQRPWPNNVEFKVLTVLEPITIDEKSEGKWMDVISDVSKRRNESATRLCTKARERLSKIVPESKVHFEIRKGVPRAEIVDCAGEWNADKILVGAHGHGICPRNILGGVSRSVAATAPCTVEIVRARAKIRQPHSQKVTQ